MELLRNLWCLTVHFAYIERGSCGYWFWWECRRCYNSRIWRMAPRRRPRSAWWDVA